MDGRLTSFRPSSLDEARLLLLLTPEGCEYAELLEKWGRPLERPYTLRLLFAYLISRQVAELRGPRYCLRVSPQVQAALAAARALVEGETVAECHNMPQLTPAQARVLLLVSLDWQTASDITDRLADRGHLTQQVSVKKHLDHLAGLGLIDREKGKGRSGWRYRLGSGELVEQALDAAYATVGQD